MSPTPSVRVVVVCGGGAQRFAADKLAADLDGRRVLDHLLEALPPTWEIVCVGPARATRRAVQWVREEPPGGGPAAAISTGIRDADTDVVAVVAGDMPYAAPAVARLVAAVAASATSRSVAAAIDVDGSSRAHPLLFAARTEALRAVLTGDPAGQRARMFVDALQPELIGLPAAALLDIDTPADLERARLVSQHVGDHDPGVR